MDYKKLLPHLFGILILLGTAAVFFAPNAFGGKVLPQPDNDKARGMSTEIQAYIQKDGKAPLWTNSAFGGMPSYQIYLPIKGNLTVPVQKTLFLWTDITAVWAQVFVAMLCMYFLLSVLGADWRAAVFGALAFGITSYNVDIAEAGHSTKLAALAMAPALLAGIVLTFNGRLALGGGITALVLAMQVYVNHVQITYYTLLLAGIYFLARFVQAIREGRLTAWAASLGVVAGALAIGFMCNLSRLWPTYEYSKETIRGKSELASKSDKGDGLDKEYAFDWSLGIDEAFTLLVPRYAGGGNNESYTKTALYKRLRTQYAAQMTPQQANQQTGGLMYTGSQPFVGTAIYFGAIVIFLFILGALLVPGTIKWWLLSAGLFTVSIAWGKNFFLNDVWYAILPMFNKFRAVTMALGLGQLCFAALAAMGLQQLASEGVPADRKRKALLWSAGITAGLCLVAIVLANGSGANDAMLKDVPELLRLLEADRADRLQGDAFRSLVFVVFAAALLWLYLRGTLKAGLTVLAVAGLALFDHWSVARRTLTNDQYQTKREAVAPPKEEAYDQQIKQDPDLHYRVLDLSRGGITGNAITSYFHKSLSGYHAAKLQRYQEVVDSVLNLDIAGSMPIIGMFNGKYIVSQEGKVFPNPEAAGNAWFVTHYFTLPTADAELHALRTLHPRDTAVLQENQAAPLQGFTIQPDSTARIRLISYHPDRMEYEYSAQTEQLAVFSEIYYPPAKGWKTYLNGQPAPDFFKVDYLLRGMRLPAGQNMKLEMRFEPRSYYLGETISYIASIIVLLLFGFGLYFYFRKNSLPEATHLTEVEKTVQKTPAAPAPAPKPTRPQTGRKKQ